MHKVLFVGVSFCVISHPPWSLKNLPQSLALAKDLQKVSKRTTIDGQDFLSKFLMEFLQLVNMRQSMVWQLLLFINNVVLGGLQSQRIALSTRKIKLLII